jgi:hypothetical protein
LEFRALVAQKWWIERSVARGKMRGEARVMASRDGRPIHLG